MKTLFVFFWSIAVINLPAFASIQGEVGVAERPSCSLLLTVFDENVHPPFAHGIELIRALDSNRKHNILNRNGNVFEVESEDPAELMEWVVNGRAKVTSITMKDGQEIPVFGAPIELGSRNRPSEKVLNLYQIMAQLPKGAYTLFDEKNSQTVTMFVTTTGNQVAHDRPVEFPQLSIDIWPGKVVLPQSEEFFGERRIASFSNTAGSVDFWDIKEVGLGRLKLESEFPYVFDYDKHRDKDIEINFVPGTSGPTSLKWVEVAGRTFTLVSLRPRRHL